MHPLSRETTLANSYLPKLPEGPFSIMTSFLSLKEFKRLPTVCKALNTLTIDVIKPHNLSRIRDLNLAQLFTSNEASNSEASKKSEKSNPSNSVLSSEQELKLKKSAITLSISRLQLIKQEFAKNLAILIHTGILNSTLFFKLKNALEGNRARNIEKIKAIKVEYQAFIDRDLDLIEEAIKSLQPISVIEGIVKKHYKLDLTLLQKAITSPEPFSAIKEVINKHHELTLCLLQEAINSPEPKNIEDVIQSHYKSSQLIMDLDLLFTLQSDSNPYAASSQQVIKKYGGTYLGLVESFFIEMPSHRVRQIQSHDIQPIIKSLLEKNQLTKAVNFVSTLIKKHPCYSDFELKEQQDSDLNELQSFKNNLYGVIIFPYIDKSDFSNVISILKVIPKEYYVSGSLSRAFKRALSQNNYQAISDILDAVQIGDLDPYCKKGIRVTVELGAATQYILSGNEPGQGIAEAIKFMRMIPHRTMRIFILKKIVNMLGYNNNYRKYLNDLSDSDRRVRRMSDNELQFEVLSSFLMKVLFLKQERSTAFELFKEMIETQRSKYVRPLIQLYIERNDYGGASQVVMGISEEKERAELNQWILVQRRLSRYRLNTTLDFFQTDVLKKN